MTVQTSLSNIPVVLMHGIGGAARIWEPQIAFFEQHKLHPVPLDLPGYGARPPVDTMNFEDLAADVEVTIAHLGLDRPVLLGHSMGGMIAQTMLRRAPSAYRAAILCSTSPAFGRSDGDFQRQFIADRLAPLDAGQSMTDIAEDSFARITGPAGATSPYRALGISTLAHTPVATYRAAVTCITTFDERDNLARIATPVLCLVGALDTSAPAPMMEKMASKIPGAHFTCLPGIGHLPNIEAPDAFNAAVLEFLTGLSIAQKP